MVSLSDCPTSSSTQDGDNFHSILQFMYAHTPPLVVYMITIVSKKIWPHITTVHTLGNLCLDSRVAVTFDFSSVMFSALMDFVNFLVIAVTFVDTVCTHNQESLSLKVFVLFVVLRRPVTANENTVGHNSQSVAKSDKNIHIMIFLT